MLRSTKIQLIALIIGVAVVLGTGIILTVTH